MANEIERKYLVDHTLIESVLVKGKTIKQGYIPTQNGVTVRVRIKDDNAFLTLKGKTVGITRSEYEYPIPLDEAEAMLSNFCGKNKISKTRYEVKHGNLIWEIDVFHELNEGLIIAEVELESESQKIALPNWVTEEVSNDKKFYNVNLMHRPFSQWE